MTKQHLFEEKLPKYSEKNAITQFIKLVVEIVTGKIRSAFFSKELQSPTAGVQMK